MIIVNEIQPGIVQVTIPVKQYGQAGKHWKDTLDGPNHKGYGKIYIQRFGANRRRYESCWPMRGVYAGNPGANLDECPGAMFIWTSAKAADVEGIDAIDNQALGRDLGKALQHCEQKDENDLWEVRFRFLP